MPTTDPTIPASTPAALAAMAVFTVVFAVATIRRVHLGVLMFVAACFVGSALAGMPLRDIVSGFPVSILVLVAGVTYFFGIAQLNGTVDRVIGALIARTGGGPTTLPVVFFGLAALASAMGSPQAGLVTGPIGMPAAKRAGVDAGLMAIAINSGISAGAFAPTSLFGVITYRIARQAGIEITAWTLLAVAVVANLVLLAVALVLYRGASTTTMPPASARAHEADRTTPHGAGERTAPRDVSQSAALAASPAPSSAPTVVRRWHQGATVACLAALVATIVVCAAVDVEPDIGVTTLALGAALVLIEPGLGARAFAKIDWSSAFVVGGIVTYVAVLQRLGAVDLLGRAAIGIGTPTVAAIGVCVIAALVSAFASTTGVLAALVPLAVPLASTGDVPGWALITALGVCATVVDASPFSNTGATLVACVPEDDRPRLRSQLLRWGLAMVVAGPLVLVPTLVLIG